MVIPLSISFIQSLLKVILYKFLFESKWVNVANSMVNSSYYPTLAEKQKKKELDLCVKSLTGGKLRMNIISRSTLGSENRKGLQQHAWLDGD